VGSGLANYTPTFVNGSLAIGPSPLAVTPNNKARKYGVNNPALDGVVTGLVAGDVITANFVTAATPANSVGNYDITVSSLNDQAGRAPNYVVTNNVGTLMVQPADSQVNTVSIAPVANAGGTPQFTVTATVMNISGTGGTFPGGHIVVNDCIGAACTNVATMTLGASGTANTSMATTGAITLASNGTPHSIQVSYDQQDGNFQGGATTPNAAAVAVLPTLSTTAGATISVQTIPILNPSTATGPVSYTGVVCEVESGGFPVSNTICIPNQTAIGNLAVGQTLNPPLQISISTKGSSTQAMNRLHRLQSLGLILPAVLLLPMGISAGARRKLLRRRALAWLGIGLVIALMLMSVSCGGNGFNNPNSLQPNTGQFSGTPVGNYIVQVTGTNQNGQTVVISSIPFTVGF
jgi:uncharacterized protein YdeI (BOF family)